MEYMLFSTEKYIFFNPEIPGFEILGLLAAKFGCM